MCMWHMLATTEQHRKIRKPKVVMLRKICEKLFLPQTKTQRQILIYCPAIDYVGSSIERGECYSDRQED